VIDTIFHSVGSCLVRDRVPGPGIITNLGYGISLISTLSLQHHGQPMFRSHLCHFPGYQWQHPYLAVFRLQLWTLCGHLALQDLWPLSLQCMPQCQGIGEFASETGSETWPLQVTNFPKETSASAGTCRSLLYGVRVFSTRPAPWGLVEIRFCLRF
jgi:hypothetical protein